MYLGYNTNGFSFHKIEDAIQIIAKIGYKGIAITVDIYTLNPYSSSFKTQLKEIRTLLKKYSLKSVIETGARYLLDPYKKHFPSLIEEKIELRRKRIDFIKKCISIAESLDTEIVSLWSGKSPEKEASEEILYQRLSESLKELIDFSMKKGIKLAFEPEPDMFIDTVEKYSYLKKYLGKEIFLTIDTGHLICNEKEAPERIIKKYASDIIHVHLDDMKKGIHDHLFPGEGEIDFLSLFSTFREIHYKGMLAIELPRHSNNSVVISKKAFEYFKKYIFSS